MSDFIWIVRDPSGTVIGAGTRPVSAVCEMELAEQHNPAFLTLLGALERSYPDWVVRYEANGYTLTREPLPSGTAGVVTEADARDAARWRLVRKYLSVDGEFVSEHSSKHVQWVQCDEKLMDVACAEGWSHTVESLIDRALATGTRAGDV